MTNRPLLSPVFGDQMVLQRNKLNMFWGWAAPGQRVTVSLTGRSSDGIARADGRWSVQIMPPPTGGPYEVLIDGPARRTLMDVLVGDVWLCGGQSNMDFRLGQIKNAEQELRQTDRPRIRLFSVANQVSYRPADVIDGQWRVCSPTEMATETGFSAVGYVFGAMLNEALDIPIGLIHDAVGGTPAESWADPDTLAADPDFSDAIDRVRHFRDSGQPQHGSLIAHWYDAHDAGTKARWQDHETNIAAWTSVELPDDGFAPLGLQDTPGVAWFATDIDLPDPVPPGPARIKLGRIDRADTVYVNGKCVGTGGRAEVPRDYTLPAGLLRPRKNRVAIRVFKLSGAGGFLDGPNAFSIEFIDRHPIPLDGAWHAKLGVDARPPHPLPASFDNWPTLPGVLFDGMIRPLSPLALTGAIWYQGESNAARPDQYRDLLPKMIGDWRRAFGQGAFPFYVVQLPAYGHRQSDPNVPGWALMRAAQARAAGATENAGLAITIDTGDADDIHPPDKRPVGERLARLALSHHYDKAVCGHGPTFHVAEFVKQPSGPARLRLRFLHTDGGLVTRGGMPAEFSVAGPDGVWHWADAKLDGDSVLVWSPGVPEPRRARYAWQSNPVATLYNGAGLPAAPFETEDVAASA